MSNNNFSSNDSNIYSGWLITIEHGPDIPEEFVCILSGNTDVNTISDYLRFQFIIMLSPSERLQMIYNQNLPKVTVGFIDGIRDTNFMYINVHDLICARIVENIIISSDDSGNNIIQFSQRINRRAVNGIIVSDWEESSILIPSALN